MALYAFDGTWNEAKQGTRVTRLITTAHACSH